MERSIRYNFLIDLESIQHKLSSDYGLNICMLLAPFFLYFVVHHFLPTNSYKMSSFERSVICSFFYELYSQDILLTRTQGKKFEDMFLVKIGNKGTSLRS